MKYKILLLCLLSIIVQGTFATHIIKAPGSTTDVYTELAIRDIMDPLDTLFIEGGIGDITLKAGPTDISSYNWSGTGSFTTYTITFTYANATITLSDGSKGRLIGCNRLDGLGGNLGDQYIWVVYRNLPLKPSLPSGSISVCTGALENYSSTSTNATSYEWDLTPVEAGTFSSTTGTVGITWSNSWTGDATLTVRGTDGTNYSPVSNPLTITVGTTPGTVNITGPSLLQKASNGVFGASSLDAIDYQWNSGANEGATKTLSFPSTGKQTISVKAINTCGDKTGTLDVVVIDTVATNNTITTLTNANTVLTAQITALVADTTANGIAYRNAIATLKADTTAIGIAYRNSIALLKAEKDALLASNNQLKLDTILYRQQTRDSSLAASNLRNKFADSVIVINNLNDSIQTLLDSIFYINTVDNTLVYLDSIDGLYQRIADSTALANGLRKQIADSIVIANALRAANVVLQGQVNSLTIDLATRTTERDQALAANVILQGQVNSLTTDLATRTTERDQALAANVILQGQVNSLTTDLATRTTERDQALAANVILQGQVNSLTTDLATRTTERDQALAANVVLTKQLADMTTERDNALAANVILQGQVNSLTTDLATRTTERDQALAANVVLTKQLADMTTERDNALAANVILDGQITELNNQINDLDKQITDLNAQIVELSKVIIVALSVDEVYTKVFETEIGTFNFYAYPNPNPGEIFIKYENTGIKSLKIYDISGAIIEDFTDIHDYDTSFIVDRSRYNPGTIYFIKITNYEDQYAVFKMIFE